jgi:hypothetical protein
MSTVAAASVNGLKKAVSIPYKIKRLFLLLFELKHKTSKFKLK